MTSQTHQISLNCGNLWTLPYLDKVIELNKLHAGDGIQVRSLFGSIAGLTPTARSADRLPYLEWSLLDRYIAKARNSGIHIRYTLNQSCIGALQDFKSSWDNKLRVDLKELHNIGVDQWTISSPLLVELLRDMFPEDMIEVSTICEVVTPEEILRWKNIGAGAVCLGTSVNRDFAMLKEIVKMPDIYFSLLSNEACVYKCVWRRECYSLSSHNSQRSEELFDFYPFRRCNELRLNNIAEWLKSRMILPQWMKIYQQETGISNFKIAYRTHPYEVAVPILEAYMKQMHKGNYLNLWPTVSHLGKTEEPKDLQYLSCEKLDERHFIEKFISGRIICSEKRCGDSCRYCDAMVEHVQK